MKRPNYPYKDKTPKKLSQEFVKSQILYNKETGIFTWLVNSGNSTKAGMKAGSVTNSGYVWIKIGYNRCAAHRLAWLYVHGIFPCKFLDHINGSRSDNRIANLREADSVENLRNCGISSRNKSGFKGVSWSSKYSKWQASAKLNRVANHLGYYDTAEEASAVYQNFCKLHHGEFYKPPSQLSPMWNKAKPTGELK